MMTKKDGPLLTIWEVPDGLWDRIYPVILEMDPPKSARRKRVQSRGILGGIIFRMRSGCHWNRLPRELGDESTIRRAFQRWVQLGILEGIWPELVAECQELCGVEWEWQSAALQQAQERHRQSPFWEIQQDAIPRTEARRAACAAYWLTPGEGH